MAGLENYILRILAAYPRGMGWYAIATRLSNTDAPNKSDQMKVLHRLTEQGILETHDTESGKRIWKLTEAGLAMLEKME
jgi:DNA-binding PadR family transcriptional regulator